MTFPITLTIGDNGDVGKQLYQFILNNENTYTFSDDEEVFIINSEYSTNIKVSKIYNMDGSCVIEYENMDWSH